jgi:hypothetical protein
MASCDLWPDEGSRWLLLRPACERDFGGQVAPRPRLSRFAGSLGLGSSPPKEKKRDSWGEGLRGWVRLRKGTERKEIAKETHEGKVGYPQKARLGLRRALRIPLANGGGK